MASVDEAFQRGQELRNAAQVRWLFPLEIRETLHSYNLLGFKLSLSPQEYPSNGDLLIFDRVLTPNFKDDGVPWVRKQNGAVREDFMKILIDDSHDVTGLCTYSIADQDFRRRCYRFPKGSTIFLVHYRHCGINKVYKSVNTVSIMPKGLSKYDHTRVDTETSSTSNETKGEIPSCIFDEDDDMDNEMLKSLLDDNDVLNGFGMDLIPNEIPPTLPPETLQLTPAIIDFSPSVDYTGGGNRILVSLWPCLSEDLMRSLTGLQVIFGWRMVDAIVVSPSCVRAISPNLPPGRYPLTLRACQGLNMWNITSPSSPTFDYYDIRQSVNVSQLPPSQTIEPVTPQQLPAIQPSLLGQRLKREWSDESTLPPSVMSRTNSANSTTSFSVDSSEQRERKVILVEAKTYNNSLDTSYHSSASKAGTSSNSFPADVPKPSADYWLEDAALSELGPSALSGMMDHVLLSVVNQLVQFASSDEALRSELDALDSSGFSLLHYCSLYNLALVVPVLLDKGSNVHRKTACGTTALHLAAGTGHVAVTEVLLRAGADVNAKDAYDLRPLDRAAHSGHSAVVQLLLQSGSQPTDESRRQFSPRTGQWSPNGGSDTDTSLIDLTQCSSPSNTLTPPPPLYRSLKRSSEESGTGILPVGALDTSISRSRSGSVSMDVMTPDTAQRSNASLLYEAFSSLSLVDKCAFSLAAAQEDVGSKSRARVALDCQPDDDFDVQSVLSESDKESLDVAMSMMTSSELSKVEVEVRVIQNNVRAWLLRKNYVNLREAAKVLQTAWRQRKQSDSQADCETFYSHMNPCNREAGMLDSPNGKEAPTELISILDPTALPSVASRSLLSPSANQINFAVSLDDTRQREVAAETLQRNARRMLARRSFIHLKRQALASLVIQKSLLAWWLHSKDQEPPPQDTARQLEFPGTAGSGTADYSHYVVPL